MRKMFLVMLAILAGTLVTQCGGGGSTAESGGTTGLSTLSDLPRATSPMAAASGNISPMSVGVKAASLGHNLFETTSQDFLPSTGLSRGSCETINVLRDNVRAAGQADMIMCYVKELNEIGAMDNLHNADGSGINVYDGNYHIFNMIFTDEIGSPPDKVKFRVVMDDPENPNKITLFEMFMCTSGVQNEYVRQTISAENVISMTSMGLFGDQSGSGRHRVEVTGTIDTSQENNPFTYRKIVAANYGTWGGNDNRSASTLEQWLGEFKLYGYRGGQWSDSENGRSGTHGENTLTMGQMLGDTSGNIADLAMGDGAVSFSSSGAYDDGQGGGGIFESPLGYDAWLGDTLAAIDPALSDYYDDVVANAALLPAIEPENPVIDFTGHEWDCLDGAANGEVEAVDMPAVSQMQIGLACNDFAKDDLWIECYVLFPQVPN